MKKRLPFLIFVLLVFSILAVFFGDRIRAKFTKEQAKDVAPAAAAPSEYKIPPNNPNVRATYQRYVIVGRIKEIGQDNIVLEDMSGLPNLALSDATRFWRISPPYSSQTMVKIGREQFVAGKVIDISIEYDVRANVWNIWDVYLPTDRNAEI